MPRDLSVDAHLSSSFSSSLASSPDEASVLDALSELKVRARLGLKALRAGDRSLLERAGPSRRTALPDPAEWRLAHALTLVARAVGFAHWDHARRVLGGLAAPGDDHGAFWHAPACNALLNHWFAGHAEALAALERLPGATLLPYRRQYVVVARPYLEALGLADAPWPADRPRDLAAAYGSPAWRRWCALRLDAWPRQFSPSPAPARLSFAP